MSIEFDQLDDLLEDFDDDYGSADLNLLALTALKFRNDLVRHEEGERHSMNVQVRKIREQYQSHRAFLHASLVYALRKRAPNPEYFTGTWHVRRALKGTPRPYDIIIIDSNILKFRIPGTSAIPEDCEITPTSLWSLVAATPSVDDAAILSLTRIAPVDAGPKHEFARAAPTAVAALTSFAAPVRALPDTVREGPSPPGVFERLLRFDSAAERESAVAGFEYALVTSIQRALEKSILPAPSVFQFAAPVYLSAAAAALPAGPAAAAGAPVPIAVPAALSEVPAAAPAAMRHLVIASDRVCITAAHPAVAHQATPLVIAQFPISAIKALRLDPPPPSFAAAASAAGAAPSFEIDSTVVVVGEGFTIQFAAIPPHSGRLLANEIRRVQALAKEALDANAPVEQLLLERPLFGLDGIDASLVAPVEDRAE